MGFTSAFKGLILYRFKGTVRSLYKHCAGVCPLSKVGLHYIATIDVSKEALTHKTLCKFRMECISDTGQHTASSDRGKK